VLTPILILLLLLLTLLVLLLCTLQTTFAEVDRLTDDLAAWLHAHGVGVGRTVGIFMDHCDAYALAYIAAHKAGGAYMPLEVSSYTT
jgi:non-ribosomal peptide synthetase component F